MDILSQVISVIAEVFETPAPDLGADLRIVEDLGATSLDIVTLIWRVEEVFGLGEIEESALQPISTIGELAELVANRRTMSSKASDIADIAIASDHAGVQLKAALVDWLRDDGFALRDLGPTTRQSVDYPDFAQRVAHSVATGKAKQGILICGSGIGMSIAANKFDGIRAVVAANDLQARLSRQHNNANVLCLGERLTGIDMARACVRAFLKTPFEPGDDGRHQRRVQKISAPGTYPSES